MKINEIRILPTDTLKEANSKLDRCRLPQLKIGDPKNCFVTPSAYHDNEMMYGTNRYAHDDYTGPNPESIVGRICISELYGDVSDDESNSYLYNRKQAELSNYEYRYS